MKPTNHRRTSIAMAGALLAASASAGQAATFTGTTSGRFENPVGPPTMQVTRVGTSFFTWGDGSLYASPPSSLRFTGTPISSVEETFFKVGGVEYFNGTIEPGTQASQVDLQVDVQFLTPLGSLETFSYNLQLLNTPNTGDPSASADIVFLPTVFASDLFNLNGVDYTLELAFGSVSIGGFSQVDRLFAFEGQTARAELQGRITSNIPRVSDASSTALLFGLGLSGLLGMGWLTPAGWKGRNRDHGFMGNVTSQAVG